jgi:acyl carrier protein
MPFDRQQLVNYICQQTGLTSADISDDMPLFSTGVMDSFALVEMISFIESEAQIRVKTNDVILDNFDNVGAIMRFASKRAQG